MLQAIAKNQCAKRKAHQLATAWQAHITTNKSGNRRKNT